MICKQIKSFKDLTEPKSDIAIIVAHHEMEPYVGKLNYFENISLPILNRYCQKFDIDLLIIRDFKKDQYISTEPEVFGNRVTSYPLMVGQQALNYYEYVSMYASHALIHRNAISLRDAIDKDYDVIAPKLNGISYNKAQNVIYTLKGSAAQPEYNRKKVYQFYKKESNNFWAGPHIIVNKNMKKWYNPTQYQKFQMNDMIFHYCDYVENHEKYRLKIDYRLNMISMNIFIMEYMKEHRLSTAYDVISILKNNQNKILQLLSSKNFMATYFGGCGSYSPYWMMRYLMMRYLTTKFKEYYY